jgi:glycosyltransferase involved in cell wall biosynthesis
VGTAVERSEREWQRLPITDQPYAELDGVCTPGRAVLAAPVVRRLGHDVLNALMGIAVLRGLLLFAASKRHPAIAVCRDAPGSGTVTLLRAVFGRSRKLVVLQFIVHERRRHPLAPLLRRVDRWAVHRALLRGHALTGSDREALARRYRLPVERFPYVPWPLAFEPPRELPPAASEPRVVSAGRSYCDWETLFDAARDADWPLTVVCRAADRPRVEALNSGERAEVHSELEPGDYLATLRGAQVSVVAMVDGGTSQGHVRLMDAAEAGVPVVATATPSLAGYASDGESALLVPPGDAQSLRAAVDRLLADAELRERLRTRALERARGWQRADYMVALADLVHGRPVELPPGAPPAGER